jgi:hypothetical protein
MHFKPLATSATSAVLMSHITNTPKMWYSPRLTACSRMFRFVAAPMDGSDIGFVIGPPSSTLVSPALISLLEDLLGVLLRIAYSIRPIECLG